MMEAYPLHDRDHYLEFVFGMWFHTLDIAGKPHPMEVARLLHNWSAERRGQVLDLLDRRNLLAFPSLELAA